MILFHLSPFIITSTIEDTPSFGAIISFGIGAESSISSNSTIFPTSFFDHLSLCIRYFWNLSDNIRLYLV